MNTTSAFSQVRIGHSIADFVMINGEGRVYEIKSDLDNFDRLYDQLRDYYRAFSKVSVLVSIHELEKIRNVLSSFGNMGDAVGVYSLSAFQDASLPVALVINPNVGDLTDEPQIINQLLEKYLSPNVIPAILTNESAEKGLIELKSKGVDTSEILTILNDPDLIETYQAVFQQFTGTMVKRTTGKCVFRKVMLMNMAYFPGIHGMNFQTR